MGKKILCCAHSSAYALKEAVYPYLKQAGYDITDLSPGAEGDPRPYYEAGALAAQKVAAGEYDLGLVFCGSGMGVCLAANRFSRVYCAACESIYTATQARRVNNANILALGGDVVAPAMACKMAEAFINTEFLEGFPQAKQEELDQALQALNQIDYQAHHLK